MDTKANLKSSFFQNTDWYSGPRLLTLLTIILSWLGFVGGWHRHLELLSHFRLQYLLALGLFTLIFALLRRWYWLWLCVLGGLPNALAIFWLYLPVQPAIINSADSTTIKLLHANVLYKNTQYKKLLSLIEAEQPDIIVLQEVQQKWLKALQPLKAHWPYHAIPASSRIFGVAVFSRWPLVPLAIKDMSHSGRESILLTAQTGTEKSLTLLTTHTSPPLGMNLYSHWRRELEAVTTRLKTLQGPRILVGDLNTTTWAYQYQLLEQQSGLHNVRYGFGLLPTWPWPFLPAMLPLDHCLVSTEIGVRSVTTGKPIGSDHLPLLVELQL